LLWRDRLPGTLAVRRGQQVEQRALICAQLARRGRLARFDAALLEPGDEAAGLRALTLGLAGVFVARSLVFLPGDLGGGPASTYQRMDLAVYAPLCLAIAAGAGAVARRHGPSAVAVPA
jgi:hypothetical protein